MNDTSRLQVLFDTALQSYEKQTGMRLVDHPLARLLENCHSVDSIMDILQQQARAFTEFRGDDNGKVMKSLRRAVHLLHALSSSTTLGEGVGLPFPPAKSIFAAFAILLAAIKDISTSYDALVDLIESIEHFLARLEIYTGLPPTAAMGKITVKIMVELLSIIALVTKQIKQSRPLKLVKKIMGDNEVESVLQRLDRLTLDEAHTTATQTLEVVHGLVQNMRVVIDDGKASADAIWDALKIMQEVLNKMNESQRNKVQREARKWLSPPDPWQNHNTARESHYDGTSTWFVKGNTFAKWKASGPDSLLWIHGKPGAGKSVICSIVVEEVDDMRKRGLASFAFFYCDFRDDDKKNLRGLVSSLLVQLCDHSDSYSTILSKFYLAHGNGSRQASDRALIGCLADILKHPGQAPVYVIIDGLDECPNTSSMPSPREKVLRFLKELVKLNLEGLRLCVTSRPEVDIAVVLDPFSFQTVSLHDESGQRQDIVNYINSVVYTDVKMKTWRTEDKELVVNVLTRKAAGMFRWVFCQLEFLRGCLPARIRQALEELPESLDGTYERTLQDIDKANWKFAHRLFQCIAVASRPFRVEELAEFLAFDFDAEPTPIHRADWRPENPLGALLSTCSSLIAVVKTRDSAVIQFSHFSVKEFLTSTRLSSAGDTIFRFYVSMAPAHTLVAQACLGILLHLEENTINHSLRDLPLAKYAAENWMGHTQLADISANLRVGIKHLFDPSKRHLDVCIRIYDPALPRHQSLPSTRPSQLKGSYLHYAALLGLHDLIAFLVVEGRQDVNAYGFHFNQTPLHVASKAGHLEFVRTLIDHGADVNVQDHQKSTPLHLTSKGGHLECAQVLIKNGADVNAQENDKRTPLHLASRGGYVDFIRLLVGCGVDVNAQNTNKWTPLHIASNRGHIEFAQLLIQCGADVNAQEDDKRTPLHLASQGGYVEFIQLLVGHGADVNAQNKNKWTPLHIASNRGHMEFAQLLIRHGANLNAQENNKQTPLHVASQGGHVEFIQLLVGHGADVNAQNTNKWTPLHIASDHRHVDFAQALVQHGADVNARGNDDWTPLHVTSQGGHVAFIQLLVQHGAHVDAQDTNKWTPLQIASNRGHVKFAQVLVQLGADVNAQGNDKWTPLHLASRGGYVEFTHLLIRCGADVNAQNTKKWTPLHIASDHGHVQFAQVLLQHGADLNAQGNDKSTPLHLASQGGHMEFLQLLVGHGADVNAQNANKWTPLHVASGLGHVEFAQPLVQLLVGHGAGVNAQNTKMWTPLHIASDHGHVQFAQVLIQHGANVDAQTNSKSTPLHLASQKGHTEIARILLEHGANVDVNDQWGLTPFEQASIRRFREVMQLLLAHGAEDNDIQIL